ncbi:hypothetical protein [Allomuricauda sp. ARW1Y1]|jgi:hypothetical protein|uniref:hypothetical protein n=1 Tax=Allomuricauda sp. ARW1Y1 TaxID=2663843 RepID=UPI0015C7F6FC|nr:hypothetical protein [Muricauda sp. ARW1Y1]NYJ27552.1 hypothetical protein [Muricauda sp. ARW1Y1]
MDRRKKLLHGTAAFLILSAVPFIFYAYRLISTDTTGFNILGFTIEAGAHGNMNYYAYYFLGKFSFLIAFILWFLTCHHWWKYAILIPISMLVFQMAGLVNTSIEYIDEFDFWYSIPIVIPVLVVLLAMAKKMRPYAYGLDLKEQLEKEIQDVRNEKN